VTVTCADSEPEVAVRVVVPFAIAVIVAVADPDTLATDGLAEAHVMVWPDIVAPFWSLTVAVTDAVAPSAARDTAFVLAVMDVGTGVGGSLVLLQPSVTTPANARTAGRRIDRIGVPGRG
jgi:hypothetical protein